MTAKTRKIKLTGNQVYPFFVNWATTHPGLTVDQLLKGFTEFYMISDADLKALKELLKSNPASTQPSTSPETPTSSKPKTPAPQSPLVITRTPYPKWWGDLAAWNINIAAPGTFTVINPTPNHNIYIATIVLTVTDETNIIFTFGIFGNSGAMHFGGDQGPMGIVIAMGDSPAPCGTGGFKIASDGASTAVGGFVTYYSESTTIQREAK